MDDALTMLALFAAVKGSAPVILGAQVGREAQTAGHRLIHNSLEEEEAGPA